MILYSKDETSFSQPLSLEMTPWEAHRHLWRWYMILHAVISGDDYPKYTSSSLWRWCLVFVASPGAETILYTESSLIEMVTWITGYYLHFRDNALLGQPKKMFCFRFAPVFIFLKTSVGAKSVHLFIPHIISFQTNFEFRKSDHK